MQSHINETHDPSSRSWVESANTGGDFPLQNLPHGVFSRGGEPPRGGVAIGDHVLDIGRACDAGLFDGVEEAARAAAGSDLGALMGFSGPQLSDLRRRVFRLLERGSGESDGLRAIADNTLFPRRELDLHLPCQPGNFTDFLTAKHHLARSPRLSPDGNIPAQFLHFPLAYHGRASSIVPSGTRTRRPLVQRREQNGLVAFGPCRAFDFELEVGLFVRGGNKLGCRIPIAEAPRQRFGYCLLNDWSSRELQGWESVLGPFLSKSACTTISHWIVTDEALVPFRVPSGHHNSSCASSLSYLACSDEPPFGTLNVKLDAYLSTRNSREAGLAPVHLCSTNLSNMDWSFDQMIAHHTSNGCNLKPGDLLGSGTLSGVDPASRACLSEFNERGNVPVPLPNGEDRVWLEDGDEVAFYGRAERPGFVAIGFGECRGQLEPAILEGDESVLQNEPGRI